MFLFEADGHDARPGMRRRFFFLNLHLEQIKGDMFQF